MSEVSSHEDDVQSYVTDVMCKSIPACTWTREAVSRYAHDMLYAQEAEDPLFYFDTHSAIRAIEFIQLLKHSKGKWAGSRISLEPWQKFIVWNIFGWKWSSTGYRRFTRAYIEVARKNAKTTLASAIGDYMMIADGEAGAEIYSVATKRDQAKISWEIARSMVQSNSSLKSRSKLLHNRIVVGDSVFVPLSYDDKSEDGHSPHMAIIDEYHQHSGDGMVVAMETGMGARTQPLLFIITTAGFDKNSACYIEHERAQHILEESSVDESYFAIIYTLDEGDDWKDPRVWKKANPNLDVSVFSDYVSRMVVQATDSPTKTNAVLTKNFNIWTQAYSRWINYEKWSSGNLDTFDEGELLGRECYGGLDLSTTVDMSAFVLSFPPQDVNEKHKKLYWFFMPEGNIMDRAHESKVPLVLWSDMGYITLTPGDVIDYDFIESVIMTAAEHYNIREIAFDPYNSTEIVSHVQDEGINMVQFRQGYLSMNPACKEYERLLMKGQFATGDNPVMNWMIANVEVDTDPAGNIKPRKPRRDSGKKIDGVVADIMATSRALAHIEDKSISVYENRGVRSV